MGPLRTGSEVRPYERSDQDIRRVLLYVERMLNNNICYGLLLAVLFFAGLAWIGHLPKVGDVAKAWELARQAPPGPTPPFLINSNVPVIPDWQYE
jgi:hypothetical protein